MNHIARIVPTNLTSLSRLLQNPSAVEDFCIFNGVTHLEIEIDEPQESWTISPACPVIAVGDSDNPHPSADLVVDTPEELQDIAQAIAERPIASTMFVQLLRHNEKCSIDHALQAESLTFSTLQHGKEFLTWLKTRGGPIAEASDCNPVVLVERTDSVLDLILNRPEKHNAWSASMRDALCEGLALALEDRSIEQVRLRGNGPSFCSGGDLDEFGSARDAGVAHVSRTVRNAGRLIDALRDRLTVNVHGACIGAGIEVPSFSARVVSSPDAHFQLPEVRMGLVPGAGGTASILRRIGRHRLAWMGLTGERISPKTALEWGLIDEIAT